MKDSQKKLMNMFPWFFDKSETSNFYKSQDVTNRRFQELDNDLFKIYESFHLNKRLLVWREQNEPYGYVINFVANFNNLKQVTIYKKNTEYIESVIYTESFTYEDNVDSFEYSYSHSTLDDSYPESIVIPPDSFRIIVETWDEYILEKGYPENDVAQGNVFDHDRSLDIIGESNDIPRKEYLIVSEDLYPATEPPYNNCATEDDYHYMKRMIQYAEKIHTTPAPVLELWKLYGIDARMENRERLILKVWDENKHEGMDWNPQAWEHKDSFCKYAPLEGVYFYVQYSTNIPTRTQDVLLIFNIVNSYGKDISDGSYSFDIYIDDILFRRDITSLTYSLNAGNFSTTTESTVKVECKDSSKEIVGSSEFRVKVRSCDDADFYVNVSTGSDSNDGLTKDTAFKTISKACSSLEADNNLIAVATGNYTISNAITVPYSSMILGCGNVTIEDTATHTKTYVDEETLTPIGEADYGVFFKLNKSKELQLQDLKLKHGDDTHLIRNGTWINKSDRDITIVTNPVGEYEIVITSPLIKNLTYTNNIISYDTVTFEDISDLEGVIYDLEYVDNEIRYKEFTLVGEELTPEDIEVLRNAITSLTYENRMINYTVLGDEI